MAEMDYSNFNPNIKPDANDFTAGQSVMKRADVITAGAPTATQNLYLSFFTSTKTEQVSRIRILSGSTAAAATPTLVRVGLYREEPDKSITLIASIASDTTIFSVAFSAYVRTLTQSVVIEKGLRYAIGILVVTSVTSPTIYGVNVLLGSENVMEPKLCGIVSGQTDLPASVGSGSITGTGIRLYSVILP